jgi:hypothetical protein
MDLQQIFNVLIPIICGVLGWFCRELWTAVQELKGDLAKLREELPTHYVSKEDFNDRWMEVLKSLHRLEDKLDRVVEIENRK